MTGPERRAAIAQAAMRVFAREGFAGATTRHLAEAAGVSEALIYRHFESKEAILEHIQDLICDRGTSFIDELTDLPKGTETLVFLIYLIHRFIVTRGREMDGVGKDTMRLMVQSVLEGGEFVKSFHEARFARMVPFFVASAKVAVAAGDLVEDDGLSHEERFYFAHHAAVSLALMDLPSMDLFAYNQPDFAVRARNTLRFALRGIGLRDEAIARHFDEAALEARFHALFDAPQSHSRG
jgi:TetR/AcrR family transcriptional regulator, transcriptional repressor of aconitase